MDNYNSLRYNEVSMKGAHNSYQRDETIIEQIEWHPEKPYDAGCRGIELDISQSKEGNQWSVSHSSYYSSDFPQLYDYLAQLMFWSVINQGHDVITIHLDLKHVEDNFIEGIDSYIMQHFETGTTTTVYSPGKLMGDAPNLSEGAEKNGWPTLEELKSQFIFCLTGDKNAKAEYASTNPRERLCFADKDEDQDSAPDSSDRVFFNYHLYSADKNKWMPIFTQAAPRKNAIIRGYVLNGEDLWNNALNSGCHILATDKIKNYKWAMVGNTPFVKLKPLG